MNLKPYWNHELDPDTRASLPSTCVGAWVAYERINGKKAVSLVPVSNPDLLDESERSLIEPMAREALDNLRAETHA